MRFASPHLFLRALLLIMACTAPVFAAPTPAKTVSVEICEQGLNDNDAWPEVAPVASEQFTIPAFALDLVPAKYVEDGVRGERPSPSLIRMIGSVELPAGTHRILIRSRSAARLFVDGRLAAENKFAPKSGGDGSQADSERLIALDLGVGYRFAPRGEYERIAEVTVPGGPALLKLEAFVGGRESKKARRVEPGETVVAISQQGTKEWHVLSPGGAGFAYTDAAWSGYQAQLATVIEAREAAKRQALRANQDLAWEQRRAAARQWLATSREEPVPAAKGTNPIDQFLVARFESIKAQQTSGEAGSAVDYFRDIKPLLDSRCLECHRGQKSKGGLRLDSREGLLTGGDSGPAVILGNPGESELIRRVISPHDDEMMPPKGARFTVDETVLLSRWIQQNLPWPELPLVRTEIAGTVDDLTFLRRVSLDTTGVPPSPAEIRAFQADSRPDKRSRAVDRLLQDPRWADHWMPMWQDLLAENPNILNPTLNNTGPFRWWLYEALSDNLPVDRMVTQLVTQGGSAVTGGPAAFSLASQNDSAFAAKGTIVSAALLGVDTKCSRCHDSPTGATKQEQLFQLGAMLAAKPLDVPVTSSVDPVKLHAGGRKALIEVTLKPGTKVAPAWPFASFVSADVVPEAQNPRERLARLLTAPQNERFAQVIANRVWARYMGRGIVEPLDDWEKGKPTHPELLRWLGREFVRQGYDLKALSRIVLNSEAYQRAVDPSLRAPDPLYTAAEPRRLLAEQVVDSLYSTTGKPLQLEPLCLDLNGRRDTGNSVDLGTPDRAWMLASLSNERDRPSLTLPRLQAITDVLAALGWRGARQDPSSTRETAPNALQPAILANGVLTRWVTRLSDDHPLTQTAMTVSAPEALVEDLFLRILTRPPTSEERTRYGEYLTAGFAGRVRPDAPATVKPHVAPKLVTWTNHLWPESNVAKQEAAQEAERGDPPTAKLDPAWRQRCEDVIWALLNSPEFLYRS